MTPTLNARELVTMRDAHSHYACYYGDHPAWLIAAARTRDADVLDESNFDATVRAMAGPSGIASVITVTRSRLDCVHTVALSTPFPETHPHTPPSWFIVY